MILTKYPIKDVCDGIFDGPHATPKESDSGFVFLGIRNITEDGRLDFTDNRLISEDEYPKWTKRVVPTKDDIVFSYEATLHRYAILPEGFKGCLGRRMALVRVNKEIVYPKYMYFYFLSPKWRAMIEANIIVGSTVDRISILKFPNFEVQLPDLKTQIFIADTLSHYDDLIQTNQQRIALLEEAAQRLYDEWFVKLRFPNYQQVPVVDGVPEGWEKVTLSKLVDLINGYPFKPSDLGEEGYPIIKIPELRNGVQATTPRNDGSQIPTKYFVHYGDIIFSWSGTILIDEWGYDKAILNQHLFNVVPYQKERKSFIRLAIQQAIPEMVGHAIGSTMMHLRRGTVDNYELLLPPEMLLNKFCVTVDNLFSQSSILKKQNQKLTQARDELLPRLMSGQLNVIL